MPRVKQAAFHCPQCGGPTKVLRTRPAGSGRLVRYRRCESDPTHRLTTMERAAGPPPKKSPGQPPVRLALVPLMKSAGIDLLPVPAVIEPPQNLETENSR